MGVRGHLDPDSVTCHHVLLDHGVVGMGHVIPSHEGRAASPVVDDQVPQKPVPIAIDEEDACAGAVHDELWLMSEQYSDTAWERMPVPLPSMSLPITRLSAP